MHVFKLIGVLNEIMCSLRLVCFPHNHFIFVCHQSPHLQDPLNRIHFSHPGVRVTLHTTTQSGSSALRLKCLPLQIKMPLHWKLLTPPWILSLRPTHLLPSHCNLSCQLPRFVFGSDPSLSVEQSHFMSASAPEAFLPAHYSCFLLSAKWIPIKSTVLQLEFGRIHLVQRSKSHCLTSFSHVAPFHGIGYRENETVSFLQ